jgi:Short-chain alcohol dehydrogenase of unknown specificity
MIEGKVVAVTGASSGIGEATAEYLARRGAKLVLGARGADKLEEVRRRIVDAGGEAEYVAIDVARREGAAMLVARSLERFGRLDVLINNAGVMPIGKLDDLAVDDWERMVDVNVKGVLWGIAAALPVFRAQKSGHFITIASTAAKRTVPTMAVYSGTKAAVAAIMDGLRQEIAGRTSRDHHLPRIHRDQLCEPMFATKTFARSWRNRARRSRCRQQRSPRRSRMRSISRMA